MFTAQHVVLSPGVRRMLSLRMNAAHGVPTIWEKIADFFRTDVEPVFSEAEQEVVALFKPILNAAEGQFVASLVAFAKGVLSQLGSATTVEAAAQLVMAALTREGGALLALAESLGETLWQALIALALADLGKVPAPAAAGS
jgi:hypothetical protein